MLRSFILYRLKSSFRDATTYSLNYKTEHILASSQTLHETIDHGGEKKADRNNRTCSRTISANTLK